MSKKFITVSIKGAGRYILPEGLDFPEDLKLENKEDIWEFLYSNDGVEFEVDYDTLEDQEIIGISV